MSIEVFWGSGSGPSWRVMLTLTVKKLAFEPHLLQFSKREHKTPEMLAMNPRGKVPVLRDGKYTLFESLAIMTYLDRKYPTPPVLFGATPEEAGTIMRLIMEHECYAGPALATVTRPLLFGTFDDEKRELVVAGLPTLRAELESLDARLAEHAWLAGDNITAADLFAFPTLKTLERALSKPAAKTFEHKLQPLATALPRLAAWVARIEAIPGYEATYPPHWREG